MAFDRSNPYQGLPKTSYWRTGVKPHALQMSHNVPKLWEAAFPINREQKFLTLGSCFAQHISQALIKSGFTWHDAEPAPNWLTKKIAAKFHYGVFSFRVGNIYSTKVLKSWLSWAIAPETQDREVWLEDGAFFDPLRPQIQPGGFESEEALFEARSQTLEAIHKGISGSDVFVFTLGLTETWHNKTTGLTYSLCPGTQVGNFDDSQHEFKNLNYNDVYSDLDDIHELLKAMNPEIKILLTVSPVPLVATVQTDTHVLTATTHSKSTLRAAVGEFILHHDDVDYFPSYELVTGAGFAGDNFEADRRSVKMDVVDYVMEHFMAGTGVNLCHELGSNLNSIDDTYAEQQERDDLICEEILLEAGIDDTD